MPGFASPCIAVDFSVRRQGHSLFLFFLDAGLIYVSVFNFIKSLLVSPPSPPSILGLCNLKTLAIHVDKSACLETQVRQLVQMANQQQNKFDLRPLLETIDTIKQKVAFLESFDQRLGTFLFTVF